jgi:hypothetical protein
MAGSDGTPNRRMDCRGAEKGNLARELGAHHYIDSRAENPDNAMPVPLTAATSFVLLVNSAGRDARAVQKASSCGVISRAATNAAVRADREGRFFTICSSYAPILNQRREISR